MQARLDPLIAERAPWLFSGRWRDTLIRRALMRLLKYPHTLDLVTAFRDLPTDEIMARMHRLILRDLRVEGLENIPPAGPALIVANHPTGIADGLVMLAALSAIRGDLFIYANHDIIRVLPQLETVIAPVEWRIEKRSHAKARATMVYTRKALQDDGRIGLIFPSGRLAERVGLGLQERPWMSSAAMIARHFSIPVIPVRIFARNSTLFYLLDAIHASLRDVTLFHEVLNKAGQTYRVSVGPPIAAASLPRTGEEGTALLREAVLSLPAPGDTALRLTQIEHLCRLRRNEELRPTTPEKTGAERG